MIKFFRKIRQSLLVENNFRKYLLYAIGEISLVVIGIIIAVQIGNWNTNQNRKKLEKTLLAQVKEEILYVNNDLEGDIWLLLLGQRSSERIANYIEQDVAYVDSMCFDFGFLLRDEYVYPAEAVYGKIKEEGLEIIQNDTIIFFLQRLYEINFPRLSTDHSFYPDISVFLSDYYQEHFTPNNDLSLKYIDVFRKDTIKYPRPYRTVENELIQKTAGFIPLDFEDLKKDNKFQMLLAQTAEFRRYKIRRYKITQQLIELIIPLIDKEL